MPLPASQRDENHSCKGCEERATLGARSEESSTLERVAATYRFCASLRMPQSLAKILIHTVFSTKDRPLLGERPVREEIAPLPGRNSGSSRLPADHRGRGRRSRPPSVGTVANLSASRDGQGS